MMGKKRTKPTLAEVLEAMPRRDLEALRLEMRMEEAIASAQLAMAGEKPRRKKKGAG